MCIHVLACIYIYILAYVFDKGRQGRVLQQYSGGENAAVVYMTECDELQVMRLCYSDCSRECVMNRMQISYEGKTVQQYNGTAPVEQ